MEFMHPNYALPCDKCRTWNDKMKIMSSRFLFNGMRLTIVYFKCNSCNILNRYSITDNDRRIPEDVTLNF